MKLLTSIMLLLSLTIAGAQTNVIFGYISDLGMTPQANVVVTLSLVSPSPKLVGGIWVTPPAKAAKTTAAGLYSFANLVGGQYEVDSQGGFLSFTVQDTTSGSNNVVTLMTNVYVMKLPFNLNAGTNASFRTNGAEVYLDNSSGSVIPLAAGTNTVVRTSGGTNFVDVSITWNTNTLIFTIGN